MGLLSLETSSLDGLLCSFPSSAQLPHLGKRLVILHTFRARELSVWRGKCADQHRKAVCVQAMGEEKEVSGGEEGEGVASKALKAVCEMSGEAVSRLPGPRVGPTSMPWLLAIPLAYLGITFLLSLVKTIRKYNSPKQKRRRLVSQNAFLCQSLDEFLPSQRYQLDNNVLKKLESQTKFTRKEIIRKYIRYALNERPFNLDLVADLIHLRKTSQLEDIEVAEVLYDVSRRIVKEKGPVVMDTRGFTEKGIKRKAAVQALFSKLLYMAELDEFCPSWSSVKIKEIFGVTDEDADSMRIETLSEASDVESLVKMVHTDSETEEEEDIKAE